MNDNLAATVGVAGVGGFGTAVRDRLVDTVGAGPATADDLADPGRLAGFGCAVVALWRPLEDLCDGIDAAAYAAGRPWLPVVFEHPWILVGPWSAPPDGPCYRCYRGRRMQHSERTDTARAAADAYAADPTLGVSGHLPHHVRLATGLVRQVLRRREPGLVLSVNTVGSRISAHRTLGVHGCPRCGTRDRLGGDAVAAVVRAVARPVPAGLGGGR